MFKFNQRSTKDRLDSKGFTLIELMIVVALIALLMTIGIVIYTSVRKSGRITRRIEDLTQLQNTLQLYYTNNNKYPNPSSAQGSFNCISGVLSNDLTPQYMQVLPDDPSNASANCYQYQVSTDGTDYKLRTHITDGDMGTSDYLSRKEFIDPNGSGGSTSCTVGNTPIAWAIYTQGACGY